MTTLPSWLAQILVVIGGGAAATQAAINGELGAQAGSPLWAAAISNTTGGTIFAIALLSSRRVRTGLKAAWQNRLPWWTYLGGVFGAFFVFAGSYAVPLIGVALFTIAQVCGNTIGALGTDAAGLGPAGKITITWQRLTGATLAITAIVLAQTGNPTTTDNWWILPIIMLIGFGIALQGAFNGQVNEITKNPISTGSINFAIGTSVLYIIVAAAAATAWLPNLALPHQPWLYLGGPCGALLVIITMLTVRVIGVLRMSLGILAGQLTGAIISDIIRTSQAPSPWVITAVSLTATAVTIASIRARKPHIIVTTPDEPVKSPHDDDPSRPKLDSHR